MRVVEEMATNGETITVLAVHEKTGIHKLFLEHCSVVREAEIRQFMKEQIERSTNVRRAILKGPVRERIFVRIHSWK